jgi:hypothetical protein
MTRRHTRAAILAACRRKMQAGRLRPPMRVRGLRDAFRRIGNIAKAALYERRLAELESRAPESWAINQGSAP